MSREPIISIITVSYNAQNSIEETFLSVFSQNKNLYEYIVVDGESTDNTIHIINKYIDKIHVFISEKDLGIYDAMNKGIMRASCKWILFLGADDKLTPNIIDKIKGHLSSDYGAVFGKVLFENGNVMSSSLGWRTYLQNTVHHQSVFYNKTLFKNFKYDISFRAISDYELNLLIYTHRVKCKKVDLIVSECFSGGTSSDFSLSFDETNKVRHKVIKNDLINKFWSMLLFTYYFQKRVRKVSLSG